MTFVFSLWHKFRISDVSFVCPVLFSFLTKPEFKNLFSWPLLWSHTFSARFVMRHVCIMNLLFNNSIVMLVNKYFFFFFLKIF